MNSDLTDVIIFSGQSNMQGQTESVPENIESDGLYEYRFYEDELIRLAHPVGEDIGDVLLGAHEGHGSLIPSFCKAYHDCTGQKTVAVHVARGSTTVAEWLPGHSSNRYRLAVHKCRDAIRLIGASNVRKIYFVWLQGESDAIENTSKESYKSRIRELNGSLLQDLSIDGFNFIRVGKFVNDARDIEIISAQEELCHEKGYTMLTRITGYCTREKRYMNPYVAGHYNNLAMDLIGKSAGTNLGKLATGQKILLEDEPYEEMR